jgi:hypothetical protein
MAAAATVIIALDLVFIRTWGLERPGSWRAVEMLAMALCLLGALGLCIAVYHVLAAPGQSIATYERRRKVWFGGSFLVVLLGFVLAVGHSVYEDLPVRRAERVCAECDVVPAAVEKLINETRDLVLLREEPMAVWDRLHGESPLADLAVDCPACVEAIVDAAMGRR